MTNHSSNVHHATTGGLVAPPFDVNLDAPFDMMSAFPDLDPSQFAPGGGGNDGQHSPLLHHHVPGPMLGSSPMSSSIKSEGGGMGNTGNRSQQIQHTSTATTTQQQQQLRQQQQNHNNQMHQMTHQHQHHPHGAPHITDYSPEWGWTEVSKRIPAINTRLRHMEGGILYIKTSYKFLFTF